MPVWTDKIRPNAIAFQGPGWSGTWQAVSDQNDLTYAQTQYPSSTYFTFFFDAAFWMTQMTALHRVEVTIRVNRNNAPIGAVTVIQYSGTRYNGSTFVPPFDPNFGEQSHIWATRPGTLTPWAVNDLPLIGFGIYAGGDATYPTIVRMSETWIRLEIDPIVTRKTFLFPRAQVT